MEPEAVIQLLEKQALKRELSSVERWVFRQTWQGKSYLSMARESSYSAGYLKFVGAKLWSDLSPVVATTITKKNLRWVLRNYLENVETRSLQSLPLSTQTINGHRTLTRLSSKEEQAKEEQVKEEQAKDDPFIHHPFIPFPSGPVPLDSPLYVARDIERPAYGELQNSGCLLRLHGPSKTGKTSLLIRLLKQAQNWDYAVAFIDFQTVEHGILSKLNLFLQWFCANLFRQLNLERSQHISEDIQAFWDESLGATMNCTHYLEEVILAASDKPIVLALNEVNQAMSHPEVMQEILSLLRFWHEQSKHRELWKKLRIVLVYSTECYIPLRIDRSPFNVGFSLRLPPLTPKEVQQLASSHGFSWADGPEGLEALAPLIKLVGGNPYLIRLALYYLYESSATIEALITRALEPDGPYRSHLQERTKFLEEAPQLASTLRQIFEGKEASELNAKDIYHLESAGFIRYEGKCIVSSCELYHQFFKQMLNSPHRFQNHRVS